MSTAVAGAEGAKARRPPRFTELDALRGASAVAIVILHAYQNSRTIDGYAYGDDYLTRNLIINADFGLGVFFALSGFVIFLPFAKAIINGREHMGMREFAARRAFRILPLYVIAILLIWNSRYYAADGQIGDLVRHLTFTQIYHNDMIFYTIGPAWSLAVEMHYYVLAGVVAYFATKICRRVQSRTRRAVIITIVPAALAIGSIAYKAWAYYIAEMGLDNFPPPHHYTVYYSALARGDGFAFGMLLAIGFVLIGNWRPKGPGVARVLLLCALIPFVAIVAVRGDRVSDPPFVSLYYYTWIGIATCLLIAAIVISKPELPWMRFLRSGPVQFTGVVSYSLYMWHEPLMISLEKHHILVFNNPAIWPLSTAALVGLGLLVAWISYHVIEIPGQRLRHLLQIHRPRPMKKTWRSGELRVMRGTELGTLPPLRDETGAPVDLGTIAGGRPLVAFLHPGDYEGKLRTNCMTEARAYRDSAYIFDALGIRVVGISAQPPEVQKAFHDGEELPFPLLSDPGGVFSAAAGVPLWHDEHGGVSPERVTLLVDPAGTIQDVVTDETPPITRPAVAAARIEAMPIALDLAPASGARTRSAPGSPLRDGAVGALWRAVQIGRGRLERGRDDAPEPAPG